MLQCLNSYIESKILKNSSGMKFYKHKQQTVATQKVTKKSKNNSETYTLFESSSLSQVFLQSCVVGDKTSGVAGDKTFGFVVSNTVAFIAKHLVVSLKELDVLKTGGFYHKTAVFMKNGICWLNKLGLKLAFVDRDLKQLFGVVVILTASGNRKTG